MPRKRTISDDVLLDNALTLIREQGFTRQDPI
jgi:hypothetical protein